MPNGPSPSFQPPPWIEPYGEILVDLRVPAEELEAERARARHLHSIQISDRSACDLELLATGGFSPLDRFLGQTDHDSVVESMRLANGRLFPIPITLPVPEDTPLKLDSDIALRDARNELLGVMTVEQAYRWDREDVAARVFGTTDVRHPLVAEMHRWGKTNISGRLRVFQLPRHFDFQSLRLTPGDTRAALRKMGYPHVVAFQTRNPLHRVHEELTKRALHEVGGALLLHPVVGMTRPGDVDHYTRVRTYRVLADRHFDPGRVLLALLPLAMRLAGPREALWHAIIRRNFGANHLIVGRDHASPGVDSLGRPFYGPYDAQELVAAHAQELGVGMVPFRELVYLPDEDRYEEETAVPPGVRVARISGTQVRESYLKKGAQLPAWFTRPEVAQILADAHPPVHKQGMCIWFTGLSGAGKSTTAEVLVSRLMEHGRQVTLLDGDVVRTHLSRGLGFSREDRDINIRRIGYVASEIVRHGGLVVTAAVSPYRATRNDVRNMVGPDRFVEVFVDTPLEVCEARDPKGMYARARRGEVKGFTGIDDPYEPPEHAEVTLETLAASPEQNADRVLAFLVDLGYVLREGPPEDGLAHSGDSESSQA